MRRLIAFCDGTWDRADWDGGGATNVVRLMRAVLPEDPAAGARSAPVPQLAYYRQGVGTGNRIDRALGGAIGLGLAANVRDAYAFIANNYEPGDEIFLVGFSRGAYTARTIAGVIRTVGLLRKQQMGGFMDAWAFHKLKDEEREARQAEFDAIFPNRLRDVPIRCIAVFDTVGAMGVPTNRLTWNWHPCKDTYRFHTKVLGDHVQYAFQALAIDEKRPPFEPVVWQQSNSAPSNQVLKQMWFAGVHSDIGGGYADHGASDVALLWIAAELHQRGLLAIDTAALSDEFDRIKPYGAGPLHDSLSFAYKALFRRSTRTICQSATEFLHGSVAQRVQAGGYRDTAFLQAYTGRLAPMLPLEQKLCAYASQAIVKRVSFDTPKSFCEKFVAWLEGR
jgi:uncharacterized protein (DUF2235 family)